MTRSLIIGGKKGLGKAIATESFARSIVPIVVEPDALESAICSCWPNDLNYVFWVVGSFKRKTLYETTTDDLRLMVEAHLTGPLGSLAAIHRLMASARPLSEPPGKPYHLVTVASTSSWKLTEGETAYAALEAAKAHFTRNFARELVRSLPGSKATLINVGDHLEPADVARILWEEVVAQPGPYCEVQIVKNFDGSARRERGPRGPEQPF